MKNVKEGQKIVFENVTLIAKEVEPIQLCDGCFFAKNGNGVCLAEENIKYNCVNKDYKKSFIFVKK